MQQFRSTKTTALVRKNRWAVCFGLSGRCFIISWFLSSLFLFRLDFIWIYFDYDRKANYVQECSWFRVIDAGKQDGFNFFWLLWFMIYSLEILLNILFFALFFAVSSQMINFIAHDMILFERTIQISLRACMIKHESGFNMS